MNISVSAKIDMRSQFVNHGWCVNRAFLTGKEISDIQTQYWNLARESDLNEAQKTPGLIYIDDPTRLAIGWRALPLFKRALAVASDLAGRVMYQREDQIIIKLAACREETPWHQ